MHGVRILAAGLIALALSLLAPTGAAFGDTVVVDTTSDANLTGCGGAAADCSLRGAINRLNASAGPHTISFAVPSDTDPGCNATTDVCTIKPLAALPTIMEEMTIDGYSQPLSVENTNAVGAGLNTVLKIELDGSLAGITDGLVLAGGNSTVRGLVINRFNGNSLKFQTNAGNNVEGNFIGTTVDGTAAADTGGTAAGIMATSGAHGNAIGGFAPAGRNLISGNNGDGIRFDGVNGSLVVGNLIGTGISGTTDVGNTGSGVRITATAPGAVAINHLIGENVAGSANVISGNNADGVFIEGAGATANSVMGNLIGTNVGGTAALANSSDGIELSAAPGNLIGGVTAAERNLISGNTQNGVRIGGSGASGNTVMGAYIGANSSGLFTLGNGAAGVLISSAPSNCIGGVIVSSVCTPTAGAGNLIGASTSFHGIEIIGAPATGNVISGNSIQFNALNGVDINGAGGNTVGGTVALARNIISGNSTNGVVISGLGASNNEVQGNYIGTNAAGTVAVANDIGVVVSSANNCIGGEIVSSICTVAAGAGNLVSGNLFHGIEINGGTGSTVLANYIGTNAAGTAALPNGVSGIRVAASSNTIGGTTGTTPGGACTGACNLISGNTSRGIHIDIGGNSTQVIGAFIGLNAAGTAALANNGGGMTVHATGDTIGGTTPQARNVISGNGADGILLFGGGNTVRGNYIGTNSAGTAPMPNTTGSGINISGATNTIGGTGAGEANTIAFNTVNGVRVTGAGATGNSIRGNSIHSNTFDGILNTNGGNGELAAPVITSAGSAAGTSCANCVIDVYSDSDDEGRGYHGSATADDNGDGTGDWSFPGAVVGPNVTATAFDTFTQNTSMFSAPFACTDTDTDTVCDSGDNCPADANTSQTNTDAALAAAGASVTGDALGDACDDDDDNDSAGVVTTRASGPCPGTGVPIFDDCVEGYLGTNALDNCVAGPGTGGDAWPADLTGGSGGVPDSFSDISDIVTLAADFGDAVPPAPAREDLTADGFVDISDIVILATRFGDSCT